VSNLSDKLTSTNSEASQKAQIRLEQYTRCCEDIRHFDNGLWQITSLNITVAGIMIGVSLEFLSSWYRAIPIGMAAVLSLALTVTVSKYLFFQIGRAQFMRRIEAEFGVNIVPTNTEDTRRFLDSINVEIAAPTIWFVDKKAGNLIVCLMMGVTILLFVLIILSAFIPSI